MSAKAFIPPNRLSRQMGSSTLHGTVKVKRKTVILIEEEKGVPDSSHVSHARDPEVVASGFGVCTSFTCQEKLFAIQQASEDSIL